MENRESLCRLRPEAIPIPSRRLLREKSNRIVHIFWITRYWFVVILRIKTRTTRTFEIIYQTRQYGISASEYGEPYGPMTCIFRFTDDIIFIPFTCYVFCSGIYSLIASLVASLPTLVSGSCIDVASS